MWKMEQILQRKLLHQILISFHEICYRYSREDVNVQHTFLGSGKKCIVMVTVYIL